MIELDKENFEQEVLNADGFVFVDFYSESCEPCKALMPAVDELCEKYADKLKFTKVNILKARRMAIAQKVMGVPVMAVYKDGQKAAELVQAECTKENIEKMILDII
ncbi:MAG: thioredoxin family protein [Oscillospiraceae bacterium]|nr:thioredoxin family protein [Oscillospiraceae bacterium]